MKMIVKTYYKLDEKDVKEFKKWLIDNNLTIRKCAKKIGVSASFISEILHGKKTFSTHTRELFAKMGFVMKIEYFDTDSVICSYNGEVRTEDSYGHRMG